MKIIFYLIEKALFVLKIFKFLSQLFRSHKQGNKYYNIHIAQYLKKQCQSENEI